MMSDVEPTDALSLRAYIDAKLDELIAPNSASRTYWCHRCDVPAPPPQWAPNLDGWCPFCGMDPRLEGPPKPWAKPRGLMGLLAT